MGKGFPGLSEDNPSMPGKPPPAMILTKQPDHLNCSFWSMGAVDLGSVLRSSMSLGAVQTLSGENAFQPLVPVTLPFTLYLKVMTTGQGRNKDRLVTGELCLLVSELQHDEYLNDPVQSFRSCKDLPRHTDPKHQYITFAKFINGERDSIQKRNTR